MQSDLSSDFPHGNRSDHDDDDGYDHDDEVPFLYMALSARLKSIDIFGRATGMAPFRLRFLLVRTLLIGKSEMKAGP